jgi:hypothetical protein
MWKRAREEREKEVVNYFIEVTSTVTKSVVQFLLKLEG